MWWLRVKKFAPQGDDTSFVDTTGGLPASDSTLPAEEPTGSDVNWTQLDEDFSHEELEPGSTVEGDLEVVPGTGDAGKTPPVGTPPVVPSAAPTPATSTPATTPPPEGTPPEQTPPVGTPPPVAPTPSAPTAEPSPLPDYAAWRSQRETDLAAQTYSITDEDASKLLTEPETVLPRMAARMHMEVMESTVRVMQTMLPRLMQSVQQTEQREVSAKSFFQTTNPDLADAQLEPAIMEMGQVYRRLNPTASPEQAAVAIGNLVRASLGIASPAQAAQAPAAAQAAPVVPFIPARGGPGGAVSGGQKDSWGQLADEFLADDN